MAEGKTSEAVESLYAAYVSAMRSRTHFTVQFYLRLPMYLQQAGRSDEAWREFNNLLTLGYPKMENSEQGRRWMEAAVYDKMRLFLEREKKFEHAVVMRAAEAMASIRADLGAPAKQGWRLERAGRCKSRDYLAARVLPLLKRGKLWHHADAVLDVMERWAAMLPDCDDNWFESEMFAVMRADRHT